jgi:phosphoribosylformylglycinamidine synthase II
MVAPDIRPKVERLLGNPLIHEFVWSDQQPLTTSLSPSPGKGSVLARSCLGDARPLVEHIDLRTCGDDELLVISQHLGLALDLEEMRTIASYFQRLGRAPTDVELQSLAQTWSEHCSHKTFKATIDFVHNGRREIIEGLLATYIAAPTASLNRRWVRSAFVDNAGVIAFDTWHDLAFKVETHNHPSALEPFGGAHTGVGGVIRDVLAVSAEPIANTDVLCFGPPDLPDEAMLAGTLHPRTVYREVVRGIADYGNNMGIPTVGGAILFHPGYSANPLVYCGTLGLVPRGKHPREPRPGDAIVVLGGRTGRDGLHGATMSSTRLDREQIEGSVVQIGNPITEKTLRDVLPRLRDEGLYHAITDCGAGGLCSAVGEMGAELGVEVELDCVPRKYAGLRPWEIWLSESQERMVLAVPPSAVARLFDLCRAYDVEATVIGHFRDDGSLRVRYHGHLVADLAMTFLHHGRPARHLQACWYSSAPIPYHAGLAADASDSLLALLAHPTIASKESVIRQYDHEVQGATIIKPLVGEAGPSDAAVLKPLPNSWRGVVVAHGINPLYGSLDPYAMAMLAVDEALRNLVAVGGSIDRAALLDNFCWGDIDDPNELGALVRAAQGCHDAALAYRTPFISGKDSLHNTSINGGTVHSIPGTLLISAVSVIADVRRTVTMDLKAKGSILYLLGSTDDELGGSHYLWIRGMEGGHVPHVRPTTTRQVMRRLTRAIRDGLVLSCHDLSEGGLAVAAAEMVIAGGVGVELRLEALPRPPNVGAGRQCLSAEALLFSESPGRFLVEVAPMNANRFKQLFYGLPCAAIGRTRGQRLVVRHEGSTVIDLDGVDLAAAWRRT